MTNPLVQRLQTAMEQERRYANEPYYQLLSDAVEEITRDRSALELIRGLSLTFISKNGIEITKIAEAALEGKPEQRS